MPTASGSRGIFRSALNIARNPVVQGLANTASKQILQDMGKKRKLSQLTREASLSVARQRQRKKTGVKSGADAKHTAKVRKRGKIAVRGRAKVKVSKTFAAKVSKALEVKKVRGYFKTINPAGIGLTGTDVQMRSDIYPNVSGKLFSAEQVLHAASRLWNGKAAKSNPLYNDANNLSPADSIIDVISQKWTCHMKNNTDRQIFVKVYKCQPKSLSNNGNPQALWDSGLQAMLTNGQMIGTPAVTINTNELTPAISPEFRANYKTECLTFRFEAGQENSFVIQGPKMVYDMAKFYDNGTFMLYQKQDVLLVIVTMNDLVNDAAGVVVGRPGQLITDGLLCMEWIQEVVIAMPETIGWVSSGAAPAAGNVLNVNREPRYCIDQFESTTMTGIHRVDVDQPMTHFA